jgi:WD40 repeat protein
VYDLSTTQVVQEFKNIHGNFINISRFSNLSPNVFSTSSFDKTVKTWDMRMRNSTSDTEPAPPQMPIYEASCDTGVVMINFSKDDMFLLASCVDNEINQYHFLDGKKHMSFKIPRIESVNNYTRSYYTTSGNHIVTGSCEEKNVKILSTETGEVLSSLEIYDGRKDDSIYVQVLCCTAFYFIVEIVILYIHPSEPSQQPK